MDLSDGLVKDLERMLRASGVGGRLRAGDVPFSDAGAQGAGAGAAASPSSSPPATTTRSSPPCRPARRCDEPRTAAGKAGVPMTEVGTAGLSAWPQHGSGLLIDGPDGRPLAVERAGWDHF